MAERARWYVVHTYSGYENKVKTDLEKTIENRDLQHLIYDIQVPEEEVTEDNGTKVKVVKRKKFPGYVMIKMVMTDDSWYVVRNTRGATGFVGPGSKPIPLTDAEAESMGIVEQYDNVDYEVGENIRIISGSFTGVVAQIDEIYPDKRKVKVLVNMFGRETPADVNFNQIEKI
ncbi:MAG: transcription termination/antitermination protein NusG [Clostridium sp.]|uniref:transcription termination/antitermination protein NusG n=1 Tax=Clostridium sp. TaxID=1506 RepID=UPI002FCA2BD2